MTDYQTISDSELDNEEFFFESDHLALRGNADYTAVLRTIVVLQAQKIQATRDIEKIAAAEKEALNDPAEFLQKLTSGQLEEMPGPINVIEIPKINFEKYNIVAPEYLNEEPKINENHNSTVRKRMLDQPKPGTYNRLWTCEEQLRLEELLTEYPPEPIEMRRFAKIAKALGTRTTQQVASRVQKFFQKLHSAGMPIPGRMPKAHRQYVSKANRLFQKSVRPTTFFPANYVPVTINDDDDFNSEENSICIDSNSYRQAWMSKNLGIQDDSSVIDQRTTVVDENTDTDDVSDTKNHEKMMKLMQRIKRDKELTMETDRPISEHIGFKCDICDEEPINGTRWHCKTCTDTSIDFCTDCVITQMYSTQPHPIDHKLIGLRVIVESALSSVQSEMDSDDDNNNDDPDGDADADLGDIISDDNYKSQSDSVQFGQDSVCDKDYLNNSNYNYMDPNFFPQ